MKHLILVNNFNIFIDVSGKTVLTGITIRILIYKH